MANLPKYVRRMAPQDGTFYIVVIHSPQLMPFSKKEWQLDADSRHYKNEDAQPST